MHSDTFIQRLQDGGRDLRYLDQKVAAVPWLVERRFDIGRIPGASLSRLV
jgi:hypothetical protein